MLLDQRQANYSPWTKAGPQIACVSKVLLEQSRSYLFTHSLWLAFAL